MHKWGVCRAHIQAPLIPLHPNTWVLEVHMLSSAWLIESFSVSSQNADAQHMVVQSGGRMHRAIPESRSSPRALLHMQPHGAFVLRRSASGPSSALVSQLWRCGSCGDRVWTGQAKPGKLWRAIFLGGVLVNNCVCMILHLQSAHLSPVLLPWWQHCSLVVHHSLVYL